MRGEDRVFNKVKRLKVQSGDILVFNVDPASVPPDKFYAKINATLDDIRAKLKEMGKTDVTLLVLGPDQTVNMVSQSAMNKAGWFRNEKTS